MIIKSEFKPAWWLANPHMQTMWGTLLRKTPELPSRRERLELPDGDFLDLNWVEPSTASDQSPLILVLHGLGGSIESHYAKSIMQEIHDQGWRGVFMHYRGCSGMPNRKPHSYHSGYTEDVSFVVELLMNRYPRCEIAAVGYSLGGNILLKWLGETRLDNPLTTAIAISVPFELDKAANRMLTGLSRLYQWHILRQLRVHIEDKFQIVTSPIALDNLHNHKTFWEFDTHITAPLHGFIDAHDYYQKSSSRKYLKTIEKPTLILHAKDDPFMTPAVIPEEHELSDAVILEISEQGGHVGFINGQVPGNPYYWLDTRIIEHLKKILDTKRLSTTDSI